MIDGVRKNDSFLKLLIKLFFTQISSNRLLKKHLVTNMSINVFTLFLAIISSL